VALGASFSYGLTYIFRVTSQTSLFWPITPFEIKLGNASDVLAMAREDLRQVLERTRRFGLKMNSKKCAFGVSAGQFLGFLVHEWGIEIGLKSQEAVRTMVPPTMKRELQQLIGKINFVRRFISNLSGRIEPFMDLVKIKADEEFRCEG
jgi:hypothetical protein